MECLDTEMLCRYMDEDLEAGMHSEVAAHLHTCRQCTEQLQMFLANNASLRRVTPQPPRSTGRTAACYSAAALSAYSSGQLPPAEDTRCEQHLLACDVCLQEVLAIRGTLAVLHREPLLAPPPGLIAAVQSRTANAPRQASVETLGTLVIQFVRNGLEFVEALLLPEQVRLTIGEQLVPVGALRGVSEGAERVALLEIQQSVRDLSCHIKVLPEDTGTAHLTLQLTRQGTPLPRKRVSVAKNGRLLASQQTSASGEVVFARLSPGEYALHIPQENVETQIVLRGAAAGAERE
jgi:anti-sigma factor RsiW